MRRFADCGPLDDESVSKFLNHVETGVTTVYDRHSYDPEKRAALEFWGRESRSLLRSALGWDEMAPLVVRVEIPGDAMGDVDASQLSVELRRLWAVDQVRQHRLGIGKAAEVAGLPRAAFMQLLGSHGLPVIDYPLDDLREELRSTSPR